MANGSFIHVVKSDGTVWSWGNNSSGTSVSFGAPEQVIGLVDVTSIGLGYSSVFALKADGTVSAWGSNMNGQLGNGSIQASRIPVEVIGVSDAVAIAENLPNSVYWNFVVLQDGTVKSWGHNGLGIRADGSNIFQPDPGQLSGLDDVTTVVGTSPNGTLSVYALRADNTVWAWGYNSDYQLGDGTNLSRSTPQRVVGIDNVVSLVSGAVSVHALRADGTVWSW
ncbi:MAG: hypothetical protein LBG70_03730, partial [Bifidobacteriaceae bacterium]|nr:hypothetical protein [Bifidobacteriaceae bacterium]